MSILDSLLRSLDTGADSKQPDLFAAVTQFVERNGGLNALLQKLSDSGAAEQVQSWIGNGANQPISADTLGQFLDPQTREQLSRMFGSAEGGLGQLSELLPRFVDAMSPEGKAPPENDVQSAISGLLGRLTR